MSSVPLRILLDTNVWRQLSDAHAIEPLRMGAKASKVHILVAPAAELKTRRAKELVDDARDW
jgi:hypothetical protein